MTGLPSADGPLIIIANEFFDALPVSQAVKTADGWHERVVGLDGEGRLRFGLHPSALPGFERALPQHLRDAPVGAIFEWRADAEIARSAGVLRSFGRTALIIDYGHVASAFGDTLQAVKGHRYAGPLDAPGEADLTAHVDFAALATAERLGLAAHGPRTQREFLLALEIEARAARLKTSATSAQTGDIEAAARAPDWRWSRRHGQSV